jgi:prevent-host-death family protein
MATTVTIQEAKAQLSELIHLAEQGEEIIIAQDDQPKVKLVPVPPKKTGKRVFGAYRGKIRMSEDFIGSQPCVRSRRRPTPLTISSHLGSEAGWII